MMFKRLISLVLIVCILVSGTVFASSNYENNQIIDYEKELSREEYINRLAEVQNITTVEAKMKIVELEEKYDKGKAIESSKIKDKGSISPLADGFYTYHEYIIIKDFGVGRKVEQGVLYIRYNYLSFREIVGISDAWTGPYSSGIYTWDEYYHDYNYTSTSVSQRARGLVEVKVDVSVSGGAELKQKLLGAGFEVGVEAGTTFYLRKIESWSGTMSIY